MDLILMNQDLQAYGYKAAITGPHKEAVLADIKAGRNIFQQYDLQTCIEAVGDENFAALLKNTANKTLLKSFKFWPSTWQKIVNSPFGNRRDFKDNTVIEVEEGARLQEMSKREPTPMDSIGERSLTYKVKTYERGFELNRQDIINDDLGAFMKFPQKHGRAAARTIDKFVWDFVNDNATLGFDNVALFHADHANLSTTTPLTAANLSLVKAKMTRQTESKTSDVLGLVPNILAVPPTLADKAFRIVHAPLLAGTGNNDANPHKNLEILVVPWLTDTGAEATCDWYLFASPNQIDTIQIDFLRGRSEPQTLRAIPNSPDGYDFLTRNTAYKVRYEFGGKPVGYRWAQKADAV